MVTGKDGSCHCCLVSFAFSRLGLGLWRIVAEHTRYNAHQMDDPQGHKCQKKHQAKDSRFPFVGVVLKKEFGGSNARCHC